MTDELWKCAEQSLDRGSCFPLRESGNLAKAALSHQLLAAGEAVEAEKHLCLKKSCLLFAEPQLPPVSIFFCFLHKSGIRMKSYLNANVQLLEPHCLFLIF